MEAIERENIQALSAAQAKIAATLALNAIACRSWRLSKSSTGRSNLICRSHFRQPHL